MSQTEPNPKSATAEELSVPAWVYPYRAGVVGGALGGIAMIGVAVIYGFSSGQGVWLPVNLIGATVVRDLQSAPLERLAEFNPVTLLVGLTLHMALSIGLGFIFALILPTFPGPPLLWAIIIGPLLWALASVLILPLINPVMAQYVDHLSFFIAHLVYSIVLGLWIARTPKVRA